MTVKEAKKKLKEVGLGIQSESKEEIDEETAVIKEQIPKQGIKVYEGTKIIISTQ